MTRAAALKLLTEAVADVINRKYAYAAGLYDSGAATDAWARSAAEKRDQLRAALETVREPERLLL